MKSRPNGVLARRTRRSAAPRKPQTAEADRAPNAYGLYCQLCETLTGEDIPEPDVLRAALQKAKRELAAYNGAGQRYEAEIARLKEMAAEDIRRAALSGFSRVVGPPPSGTGRS